MAETKVANLGLLLRCYEALRNWRALLTLAIGFVVAALLLALSGVIAEQLMVHGWFKLAGAAGILIGVIAWLVVLVGINATGLLLVDQADGSPSRGFGAAFFGGLGVTGQSIVCLLILGVGMVLIVLILWALSFLGRIPGIGPMFSFLLAGPTMLVLGACFAVLAFGVSLMSVALWRGNGMLGSLGRAIDIVLKRPLDVVLHFIVLWLLIVPIEIFVALVLYAGAMLTLMMYASSGGLVNGLSAYGGGYGGSPLGALMGSAASLGGASASLGIVFAAVMALFVLISMLGNILIYDSLAGSTEAGSADFLRAKAAQMKARVDENRPRAAPAPAYAAPAPMAPPPAAPATPPPVAPATPPPVAQAPVVPQAASPAPASCVSCGATMTPGDRFCGECGSAQA